MIEVLFMHLPHGEGLPLPSYETDSAAGLDLRAALKDDNVVTLAPGERSLIPLGLAMALPTGYEAQVRPRSGLALKHGVTVLNAPGTIDADYRGELQVILINLGQQHFNVRRGDRIAQLVIAPVTIVSVIATALLEPTNRSKSGFGSTGT